MTKFIYLFSGGKASENSMEKWNKWMSDLVQSGKFVSGFPFMPQGKRATGEMNISDYDGGASNAISSFIIIEAKDMEEAVKISEGCPAYEEGGTIEIREEMPMQV